MLLATNISWVKHNYTIIHTPNYKFKIQYDQKKKKKKNQLMQVCAPFPN